MNKSERDRLSQRSKLETLRQNPQLTDMLTVYMSNSGDSYYHGVYGVLVPIENIDYVLSGPHWDFHYDEGMPTFVHHNDEERTVEYLRYGNSKGFEPLVLNRHFYGIKSDYSEINEEFRLFHRLYHDPKTSTFRKISSSGTEHLVIEIEQQTVKMRLKEIREFLAAKNMVLSLQFDFCEYSHYSCQDQQTGMKPGIHEYTEPENLLSWGLAYNDIPDTKWKSGSSLRGKKLFMPLPKPKNNFFDLEQRQEEYLNFIIGMDESGNTVEFTSNPDKLANFFGSNPGAPNYLTPVHFGKEVLDKYFHKPSRYSVESSILRCGSLWALQMDNHHSDKVCAWLGDLGRDLPYKEQLHWRAYNLPPQGSLSETFYKNQLLAIPTDSNQIMDLFEKSFDELRTASESAFGWPLLLPLPSQDRHLIQSLRVPASDEQKEFDELVLALAKILVDSLNKKGLMKLIPMQERDDSKGSIRILETVCESFDVEGFDRHISYLRKIQDLRSSGSAHRKGKNYARAARQYDVEDRDLRAVFSETLEQAVEALDFFAAVVNSGRMNAGKKQLVDLPSGRESVFPETQPEDVFGCVAWAGPPRSLEDMEAGVLKEAKRRDESA